jgi:hypothetical protein
MELVRVATPGFRRVGVVGTSALQQTLQSAATDRQRAFHFEQLERQVLVAAVRILVRQPGDAIGELVEGGRDR